MTAGLGAFCGLLLLGVEGPLLLALLQGLTPLVLLPAWPIGAVALLRRRWALTGLAALVVAAHVALVAPAVVPNHRSGSSTAMTVATANIGYFSDETKQLGSWLRAQDPDVVLLQELTARRFEKLTAEGGLDRWPHRLVDPREGAFGSAILSRWPLEDAAVVEVGGLPMTRAVVEAEQRWRVVNVHTLGPSSGEGVQARNRQLSDLRSVLPRGPGAVLLAGDFNATRWHPSFRRLQAQLRVRDAHDEVGRGLARTWPVGRRYPPLLLLDHVLVGRGVSVRSVAEGPAGGSDHRPVIVELAV